MMALIAQNNQYTMDCAIKHVIETTFPKSLQSIYMAKYFWHENFGRHFPQNIPHLTTTSPQHFVGLFFMIGWVVAIISYSIAFLIVSTIIAIDVWNNAGLGWLSKSIATLSIVNAILCWGCMLSFRGPMPYRNWFRSQKIDVLKQIAPSQVKAKEEALYGERMADYRNLIERGYIELDATRTTERHQTTHWVTNLFWILSLAVCLVIFL
ncbi:hypothetical protein ASG50_18275 [Rhizobium sp. Leaf386]|nr:hypothetical protein ASG50_18275 [Rhizobium sp. Leaf386]